MVFEENIEYKLRFEFLYKFVWNISHSKKKWASYDYKYTL
jgi:hypothetical protein